MPMSLSPNTTRRYSPSAIVSAVPTVGPSSEYIPPRTTANTMRREAEIVADDLESRAGIGDDQRNDDRERGGDHAAEPGREAVGVPEEGHRVSPEAEEGSVAQRDEAEAAHE